MDENIGAPRVPLIAWVVVGAVAAWLTIPALLALAVSFKQYGAAEGYSQSPWVGLANYAQAIAGPEGSKRLGNSIFFSALGLIGALALGVPLGRLVPRLGARWARYTALGVMLAPVFVPSASWASGVAPLLFGNAGAVRTFAPLVMALSGAGLVGFAGAAYEMVCPGRGFYKGVGWVALLWAFQGLTPDFELLYLLRSPQGDAAADTLDAYAFRQGVAELMPGLGAAAFWVKALLQAALCAILSVGVHAVFLRGRGEPIDTVLRERKALPFALWAVPVGALAVLGIAWLGGGLNLVSADVPLMDTASFQVVSTLLSGLLAFVLAWAAIATLRAFGYLAFCLLAALPLVLANPFVGQLLWFSRLGLLNTFVPGVVLSALDPSCILLTLLCARLSRHKQMEARPLWPLAMLPACLAMAKAWGGVLAPTLAVTRLDLYPWSMRLSAQLRQGLSGGDGWIDGFTYLGVLLPPLLFAGLAVAALSLYMRPGDTV